MMEQVQHQSNDMGGDNVTNIPSAHCRCSLHDRSQGRLRRRLQPWLQQLQAPLRRRFHVRGGLRARPLELPEGVSPVAELHTCPVHVTLDADRAEASATAVGGNGR
jgi:hypothetical protein